jgi:MFS family permease
LFAPVWGRLPDRFGRRVILLVGMFGFSATMLIPAFIETLTAAYAERFLNGIFAVAVMPVALAVIGDLAATETVLAHRLTCVHIAVFSGFLLSPMPGIWVVRAAGQLPTSGPAGSLAIQFRSEEGFESLSHHDSEIMDGWHID